VRKASVWLIPPSVLIGLVAVSGLGRYAARNAAANDDVSCFDTAPHKSMFVTSRVLEIPNTNHYVYIVEEALVVREMRTFLLGN
jgi:hypothetical protein